MENKININNYFDKGTFVIPTYQRGYKWSVKTQDEDSSLEYFVQSLIKAFNAELNEYFIEAVTVVEKKNENEKTVVLVDGQQRTTSLFLLFIALDDLKFVENKLIYDVREDSRKYLNSLPGISEEIEDNDPQDIYYFKIALKQIKVSIAELDKNEFSRFIKEKVFLLYNAIPEDKAVNTFIALNGLKAVMKDEELIKSDLLIKSSRVDITNDITSDEEKHSVEWKINEDRGRLARNWDKWLYWWNQKEVRTYFAISDSQHPLYYMLITYWNINKGDELKGKKNFTFDNFKSEFIRGSQNAKLHFEGLRKLQKTFEDFYNNYHDHNFLGLIIRTSKSKEDALQYFLDSNKKIKIAFEDYAKWSLVGATHNEILNTTEKVKDALNENECEELVKVRRAKDALSLINEKYVYWDENDADFIDERKEFAFRFLMLQNLREDNRLERKFNFSIWTNRSLEHIYPKSKKDKLDFNKPEFIEGSIHCIGNLVLLYGRDNSEFGAKDFDKKKSTYFNVTKPFKSRNLLHTISVFANKKWEEEEIINNKNTIINHLNEYYGLN